MKRKALKIRKFGFECLEDRRVFAGDFSVDFASTPGKLLIREAAGSTHEANNITIEKTSATDWKITPGAGQGFYLDGGSTKITTATTVTPSTQPTKLDVDTAGGNDIFNLWAVGTNFMGFDDFDIYVRGGDDTVDIWGIYTTTIKGMLFTGDNADTVSIGWCDLGFDGTGFTVDTGAGADSIELDSVSYSGTLTLSTGTDPQVHNDTIDLYDVYDYDDNDILNIATGGGDDTVIMDEVYSSIVSIVLDSGNDTVTMNATCDGETITVDGGAGSDTINNWNSQSANYPTASRSSVETVN